jgi:hypothetical protein
MALGSRISSGRVPAMTPGPVSTAAGRSGLGEPQAFAAALQQRRADDLF